MPRMIAGVLAVAAFLQAYCDITVGPGNISSFATDAGNAVVVGVSGLSWSDFNAQDSYGTKCFVHDSVVDAEKTAADNDDDYWCGPITDMNLLYITGWARKTSYATVDDMVDYFRSNVKLLRYAKTPGNINTVTEGTYGYNNNQYYDGIWRWFKATTKVDLASFVKNDSESLTPVTLGNLMGNGEYALHVDVLFDDSNKNPKWGGMYVSHSVTCCGYETDATGALTGLFIIDSDNERYGNADGGRAAPNSILYCPVAGNADQGMYAVEGIWGETSYLMPGYTALRMYQGEPKTVKLDANGGKVSPATISVVENGAYGELPLPNRKGYVFAGWWTAKDGGEFITSGKIFDLADFAGQKTPTLYAHWLQIKKLTVKDDSATVSWALDENDFDAELLNEIADGLFLNYPALYGGGQLEGKGTLEVLQGARVSVSVAGSSSDKTGKKLAFQKWTVSPSGAYLGADFDVTKSDDAQFTMPAADVTLQAAYIDPDTCGYLFVGVDGESVCLCPFGPYTDEHEHIDVPWGAFEWSPDGGKTWYKPMSDGEEEDSPAMLKAGKYTITWRSNDPNWEAPSKKTVTVAAGESQDLWGYCSYIPQVVVDVMTCENGECTLSRAGGSVTMNPKDGLVPYEKTIALTAKAAKGYVFQGYAIDRKWDYEGGSDVLTPWQYGDAFSATASTWKLMNADEEDDSYYLNEYIDCDDQKVHVVAVFKAVTEFKADDIAFSGFTFGRGGSYKVTGDAVDVRAVVGCAVKNTLCSAPVASPLSYKLDGKLPDGLKFDAKTGVLSGVPKKPGSATVKIVASDPAKNSKTLTVNVSVTALPEWIVGDFRGAMMANGSGAQDGLLELSVKSDGKVSAKVITRLGSRSVSGTLEWRDPEASYDPVDDDDDDGDEKTEFSFYDEAKDESECGVSFYPDGTIEGYADTADTSNKNRTTYVGGKMTGLRQGKDLLPDSDFLDKYYTFAFCAETTILDDIGYDDGDNGEGDGEGENDKSTNQSGYGYLTIKTDKTGGVKVAGQLPDGEKVSMSALVMPCLIESESAPTTDNIAARLYLFTSPSSYKKLGWFAMRLTLIPGGLVVSEEGAAWETSVEEASCGSICCSPFDVGASQVSVSGEGALYSAAASLENYYWNVRCAWSEDVVYGYSWKQLYKDSNDKVQSSTAYGYESAQDFGGFLFNVAVQGDKKGSVSLVEKSPAPWEVKETYKGDDGKTYTEKWWNYDEDKNGNEITDPSQLSISFTKATGIFTGKATVYFDYEQPSCKQNSQTKEIEWSYTMKHATATLPYAGVMIATENEEGKKDYRGLGAAVHTYKYSYTDENNKAKTETEKISLPVSLESAQADDEEP